jgi:hypothetical protein
VMPRCHMLVDPGKAIEMLGRVGGVCAIGEFGPSVDIAVSSLSKVVH